MGYLRTNIKIIIFLLLTIFIFLNTAIEPFIVEGMQILKFPHSEPMFFQIYASSIFLSFIALCAFSITDFKNLKPKHWVVATIFGVAVLLPMLINATSANISFAVATFFTYLASITMKNQYGNRMPFITSTKYLDIAVDISIVVGLALLRVFTAPWSDVEFGLSLNRVVLWPLAAAIAEEVIFRLFLFYIIIKLSKNNNPPFFITLLILVIPFSLWHIIDVSIRSGILYGLSNVHHIIFISTIISILAIKRGLLPAILLHFLINAIHGTVTIP